MERKKTQKTFVTIFSPHTLSSYNVQEVIAAGNHTHRTKNYSKGFFNSTSSEDLHKQGGSSCWVHSTTATNLYTPPCPRHHAEHWGELFHSSQQSYKVDTVITSSSKDEETEVQRSLNSCPRPSSEGVAMPGYPSESLAPGLSSNPCATATTPDLQERLKRRQTADCVLTWSHCHGHLCFPATFSWGDLVTECQQRRWDHWVPSPCPKGAAGPSGCRTGQAARTWRGREGESYQSCPSPMGMTETVGVRDGVCPSVESRREPQTAGLGSLRYLSKFLRLHTNPLQRTSEAKEFWKHQAARFPPCQDYHGRHFTGKAWVTQLSSDQQQDQGQPQRARVTPLRRREEPFDLRFMSTPLTMDETRGWLSSF